MILQPTTLGANMVRRAGWFGVQPGKALWRSGAPMNKTAVSKRNRRLGFTAGAAALALVLTPGSAEAQYLDPGAGSIIVQVVLAVLVGAAAGLKLYWGKIATFAGRRSKNSGGQ